MVTVYGISIHLKLQRSVTFTLLIIPPKKLLYILFCNEILLVIFNEYDIRQIESFRKRRMLVHINKTFLDENAFNLSRFALS